ncbi:hypothetical protein [Kitasatospora sp. NPDC094011]|uniref:hypothetical protein n=1 Tax=Kitasatospora sp. NPDC094011 TaxID=3364090 RepID=UPI003824AD5D
MSLRSNARWTGLLAASTAVAGAIVAVPTSAQAVTDPCGFNIADYAGTFHASYTDDFEFKHDDTVVFGPGNTATRTDVTTSDFGTYYASGILTLATSSIGAHLGFPNNTPDPGTAAGYSPACTPVAVNGKTTVAPTVTSFLIAIGYQSNQITFNRTA